MALSKDKRHSLILPWSYSGKISYFLIFSATKDQ